MKFIFFLKRIKRKIVNRIQDLNSNFYECNICGWRGNRFGSDRWHKYSTCPSCGSEVRHRLLLACLEYQKELGIDICLRGKRILHFAPERIISKVISKFTNTYRTADLVRKDCDFNIDMCDMKTISSSSFDVAIAFDVLEHVPNYKTALKEIRRILVDNGVAILSVPQRDNLLDTYEDKNIVLPKEREKAYGQWDHLRIFGDNFGSLISKEGFHTIEINHESFNNILSLRHMLQHPIPSSDINATNNRRLYFCKKI